MPAAPVNNPEHSSRRLAGFLTFLLLLILISARPAMAKDLVLGFVPEQCQLLADVRQAEAFASYLEEGAGIPVRVRVFNDERNLQHWMNRFREIDLAVLSRSYLQATGKGRFIPLAEYVDAGSRQYGGGVVVGRVGLRRDVFSHLRKRLLDAARDPAARELLAALKITGFVPPRQPRAGQDRFSRRREGRRLATPSSLPLPPGATPATPPASRTVERSREGAVALELVSPPSGGWTGPEPLLLFETEASVVRITLDGASLKMKSGQRFGPLSDGPHELKFSSPSFIQPLVFTFRVDATPPTIAADLPEHPVSSAKVLVSGSRETDARLRLLDVEGRETGQISFPDRQHWQAHLSGLVEGINRFQVEARDVYGNLLRMPLVLVRDSRPPELVVSSPQPGGIYSSVPDLSYHSDADRLLFELDGQPVASPEAALAAVPDGGHQLRVSALDAAGNRTVAQVDFDLDRQPPQLTVEPHDDLLATSSILLRGSLETGARLALGLQPPSILAKLSYPLPGRWQLQLSNLGEGENRVVLRARDAAGNMATKELSLGVDLTPPDLRILSPAAGAVFRTSPKLELVTDAGQLRVQLDGQDLPLAAGSAVSSLPPLAEGEHVLKVMATDAAGNLTEVSRVIRIDTSAPDLQLLLPQPGPTSDPNPVFNYVGDAVQVRVRLDGEPLVVDNGARLGPLADGEHRLQLEAQDAAGNQRRLEVAFTVDTSPAKLLVDEGAGAGQGPERVVAGRLEPGARLEVEGPGLDIGAVRYPVEGHWEVGVAGLSPGENHLVLVAVDAAGNQSRLPLILVRDDESPQVALQSPADGAQYASLPRLEYEVSDGDVSFKLDGVGIGLVSGQPLPELADGEHVLLLEAVDAAGNRTALAHRFRIDRQPPRLEVTPPPQAISAENLLLSGRVNESGPVRVLAADGTEQCRVAVIAGGDWECRLENLPEGRLELNVTAEDAAGNRARQPLVLAVDRTPPVLVWHYPLPGTYAGLDHIEYQLNEGHLELRVDGRPLAAAEDIASLELAPGPHHIEAVAVDAAGNRSSQLVDLTIDRQAPRVEIQAPVELSNVAVPRLEFTYSEGKPTVFLDDRPLTVSSGELLPPLEDGEHSLRIEVRDAAGNLGQASSRFRVDTTHPELSLAGPPGPVAGEQVDLEVRTSSGAELRASAGDRELVVERVEDGQFRVHVDQLREGRNPVRLWAQGVNGLTTSLQTQVVRDSTPPVVELLEPAPGTYTKASLRLKYRVDGPETGREILLDGQPVETDAEGNLPALEDGEHDLEVRVSDLAGNVGSAAVTFGVDTTPPAFQVQLDPRPQAVDKLTLRGSREAGAFIELLAPQGVTVSAPRYPAGNSWEIDLSELPEGKLPLHFSARDPYGNLSRQDLILEIDRTPPELHVQSPRPGVSNDPNPKLEIDGESGARAVLLNGQPVLAAVNHLGPLADGNYVLLVREQDLAGNQSQKRVSFSIDTQAPDVVINSPAAGARTSAYPILDFKASDGTVAVALDGASVDLPAGGPLPRLADGVHRVLVTATDEAGNLGQAEVEFFVDSSAPEVVLLSPASGLTPDPTPLLEYEIDRGEARVLVDDKVVDKRSGMSLDPLAEGEHVVRVEAWDETGNVGFAERHLVVTTARPTTFGGDRIADELKEFSVRISPAAVTLGHTGLLTLSVGPLRHAGGVLYLEQWIDANGNGVADSGEQIVRVFKLVDGLASPSPRVPGDLDGIADRMITTRLSLDQLHDGSAAPVRYVLLAMGDSNVAETLFRVLPEP